ncbi:MAG: hypothetical protein PWR13_1208 [Archaeoglobi archaeon]|nr:hypothetical protein [Archaeoglobi archaeon]MDK2782180.1 hypothetical protein [Archaeoglobi archaeon]
MEEAGLDGWEIVDEGAQKLNEENIKLFRDALSSTNLELSVHAPFSDLNLASLNEGILEETRRQILESLERAHEIEAEVVVIHPGHYSPLGLQLPDKVWEHCVESFIRISKKAEELNLKACVENMTNVFMMLCRNPEEVSELIEEVSSENLWIALDVGHANLNGNLFDFMKLSKIAHMHVHDNNGKEDEHLAVGEGNVDWRRFARELKKIDFTGAMTLELRTIEEAVRSMRFLEKILK